MSYEMQPQHYRIHWLIAVLAIILGVTFFPYLFGGKTFLPTDLFDTMTAPYKAEFGPPQAQNHYVFDGLAQEYPYKVVTKEAFKRGELAYWNPHILAGYPQYAECLGNNFDIFNVLLLWFDPLDVIHWETVIELLVAGIGMIFLLRFFGVSPIVNLVFASAYMLNSMFISSAHYRCPIASFCWIPLVVLMLLRYFYYNRKENILYSSLFLALCFLGGNFQTSFFAAFIVLVIVFSYPSTILKYKFFRRFGLLAFIGLLSFALSAIMWLPSLELLFQTIFGGGRLNSTNIYDEYTLTQRLLSFPLLISFFFPDVLGNAQSFNLRKIAGVDIINFNGAIGFLPALFAFWGCFAFWKEKTIRPFILIGLSGLLLPIATPFFAILYHRFFIVSSFSFCVVGAVAFHSFVESALIRNSFRGFFRWTKITLSGLIAVLIAAGGYIVLNYQSVFSKLTVHVAPMIPGSAFGMDNESWMYGRVEKTLHYYSFSPALWMPILGATAIVIALSYYQKDKFRRRDVLVLVLLGTVMQLSLSARTWLPTLDTSQFPIYPKNQITTYLQSDSEDGRFAVWRDAKDPYIMAANASNVYKTNDIHGYEVCTNRTMSIFHKQHNSSDSLNLRLLGLANVKYIITGKRVVTSSNLKKLFSADSLTIYENLLSKSRAYFTYRNKIVESDKAEALELLRPDFDGSEAVFVQKDAPPEIKAYTESKNSITFEKSENEEIIINAQTDSKGIFILTDTYYPGWKCYVNGKQMPIFRVNYCMRSIILDAGKSKIIFRFEPDIFKAGWSISAITTLLFISGLLFIHWNQSRKPDRKKE